MKKSDITEEAGLMYGLAVNGEFLSKEDLEEVIDALIDSYYALKGYEVIIKAELNGEGLSELMEKQMKALKKVGCTDE